MWRDLEGIEGATLGKKRQSAEFSKSMATRQAFLSDRTHRVRFVFLPKHTSWLNQIETIFGIVYRRVVRRGSFRSTAELKERLLEFIQYFNDTLVVPGRQSGIRKVLSRVVGGCGSTRKKPDTAAGSPVKCLGEDVANSAIVTRHLPSY